MQYTDTDFDRLIPVQIIGTQRSGSNLLRLMLNQLSGVYAPHPPHILKIFHPIVAYYGDLNKNRNFYELAADICEFVSVNPVPWQKGVFDPELLVKYSRERSVVELYRKLYELNALAHHATYWFNKSMKNVYYIENFTKSGFKPFIIHLIRDGRDVALSFKQAIVGEKHIYHLAKKWKEDQELSSYYVQKFGAERAIEIKYENLLTYPENEIKKICKLLNINYSEKILKFYESEDSQITATSGEMWHNLTKPIMKNNFNKYKKGLLLEDVLIFEMIAGDVLEKFGYTLENKSKERQLTFTSENIKRFDLINEQLKQEILQQAAPQDLMKREAQNNFLQRIYEKKLISVSL